MPEADLQELQAMVQELRDREAIRELKARYFRFVDDQNWEEWRELLTDDVHVDLGSGEPIEDADAFVAIVSDLMNGPTGRARTARHGHMPEITIDSATEAHGIWAHADYVEWPPDPETGARQGFKGFGRYHETYRKVDGEWKISGFRLSYLRMDPLRGEGVRDEIAGGPQNLPRTTPNNQW